MDSEDVLIEFRNTSSRMSVKQLLRFSSEERQLNHKSNDPNSPKRHFGQSTTFSISVSINTCDIQIENRTKIDIHDTIQN